MSFRLSLGSEILVLQLFGLVFSLERFGTSGASVNLSERRVILGPANAWTLDTILVAIFWGYVGSCSRSYYLCKFVKLFCYNKCL